MTTYGACKKSALLFFAISLLSLLVACATREEEATRPGTPSPSGMNSTAFALTSAVADTPSPTDAVEVTVGQTAYQIRETVHYTVTNHAESSVWYLTGGCFIPHIVRFEDEREIGLVTYVLTDEITPKELPAGESLSCRWRQFAFWNPEGEGDERFNITTSSHRVPPGQYQFRFRYAFEEEHIHSEVASMTAKSQVFTIEPATAPESSPASPNTVTTEAATVSPIMLPTPTPGPTIISVLKETYQQGEPVLITITNHLDRDIFYDTTVFRIEDGKRVPLRETITEEVIPPVRLAAGEMIGGAWDQVAFWAPEKEGVERFLDFTEESQVPPGPYQWGLMYGFTEEAALLEPITIYSQVFTVEASETNTVPPTGVAVSATPSPNPSALPQEASQVEVVVPKSVYEVGEVISYTISNHSDKSIYYRYTGCGFPYIVQWVDDEEVVLAINITEEVPDLRDIEPGGSLACTWDQTFHYTAGADPELQGHRYQVRFLYAFTEEDVDVPGGQDIMARSHVFTIGGDVRPEH